MIGKAASLSDCVRPQRPKASQKKLITVSENAVAIKSSWISENYSKTSQRREPSHTRVRGNTYNSSENSVGKKFAPKQ